MDDFASEYLEYLSIWWITYTKVYTISWKNHSDAKPYVNESKPIIFTTVGNIYSNKVKNIRNKSLRK